MAIITKLNKARKLRNDSRSQARSLAKDKRLAHRAYRHSAKQAVYMDREINEKPRLTNWHIV